MRFDYRFLLFFLLTGGLGWAGEIVRPITFPKNSGIVDVRSYGATPNDETDDTAGIQAALDAFPNSDRIVYFPAGVYLVSGTLSWPEGDSPADAQKRTILQGAGESLTVLRVPKDTDSFRGDESRPVIWTGERPAHRFRNAIRDLTIEVGAGNWNAIGIQFNASEQGCLRNVTIRSMDGGGKIGLDMGYTDEIGPLFVKNLTVDGFEFGISTKWPVNSNTFEHVFLKNQRRFGWWNYHQMIFVRDLISENKVTALYNERNSWGAVTLLDSYIHGIEPPADAPGILNQRELFLRRVELKGYRKQIDNNDKDHDKGDVDRSIYLSNDTSHASVVSQFREVADGTFASAGHLTYLPIKETPEVPWGDPAEEWVNVESFGADATGEMDSSEALQAAIDSGADTIFFPAGGNFLFEGTVEIRGPVRRILGLEGRFTTQGEPVWKLVDGKHPKDGKDASVVCIERMGGLNGPQGLTIQHESKRTLVVSSVTGIDVVGRGEGDIFLEDVRGHINLLNAGQSAWCRQLSSRGRGTKCRNIGGNLWILGMKAENPGTVIETSQGGVTNAFGVFVHSSAGWEDGVPAFSITDSEAIVAGLSERNFNRHPVSLWFRETQGEKSRELEEKPWVYLSR